MNTRHLAWTLIAAAGLTLPLQADIRVWTGSGDRADWFDGLNWSGSQVPQAGDIVWIADPYPGVSVLLSNSTAVLDSLTITNAVLVFTNWDTALYATNVTIMGGGRLSHALCDTNPVISNTNRVRIGCTNLAIEPGAPSALTLPDIAAAPILSSVGRGPGRTGQLWRRLRRERRTSGMDPVRGRHRQNLRFH